MPNPLKKDEGSQGGYGRRSRRSKAKIDELKGLMEKWDASLKELVAARLLSRRKKSNLHPLWMYWC
jgi:hypothetical protein